MKTSNNQLLTYTEAETQMHYLRQIIPLFLVSSSFIQLHIYNKNHIGRQIALRNCNEGK